jgi:hypothetical protein
MEIFILKKIKFYFRKRKLLIFFKRKFLFKKVIKQNKKFQFL